MPKVKADRVGETNISNCENMLMTIVEYRSCQDIDVKFADGTIVKHKVYDHFKRGKISKKSLNPTNRIGETKMMNCGMKATIIAYNTSRDITIQFEDGAIVSHKYYRDFIHNLIRHPVKHKRMSNTSVNEYTMTYYLSKLGFRKYPSGSLKSWGFGRMELDAFHEDAMIAVEYDGFFHSFCPDRDIKKDIACNKAGIKLIRIRDNLDAVSNHSTSYCLSDSRHFSREYEKILSEICNHLSTMLNCESIDVNFTRDKDVIATLYESECINTHIGEEFYNSVGDRAVIVRYTDGSNVVAKFDDGTQKKFNYANLRSGRFSKTGARNNMEGSMTIQQQRIGETRVMHCGMTAKIIKYTTCNDIDVQFEDGYIATRKSYYDFKKGCIANRKQQQQRQQQSQLRKQQRQQQRQQRIGETRIMNCGMAAKIVKYAAHVDIDVQFEDGIVVRHKTYDSFKKGNIANPNCKRKAWNKQYRVGEIRTMNCGMDAEIIKYITEADIDVRFEDGTIVRHKRYGSFIIGNIRNPNKNPQIRNERVGEIKMMNCGMIAKIIKYSGCCDIDVQFADGTVVARRTYYEFLSGRIRNSNMRRSSIETINTVLV